MCIRRTDVERRNNLRNQETTAHKCVALVYSLLDNVNPKRHSQITWKSLKSWLLVENIFVCVPYNGHWLYLYISRAVNWLWHGKCAVLEYGGGAREHADLLRERRFSPAMVSATAAQGVVPDHCVVQEQARHSWKPPAEQMKTKTTLSCGFILRRHTPSK